MKLFIANLKMLSRNKQLLFWSLAFPLIFTAIFGLFFGKDITAGNVILINESKSELATTLEKTFTDTNLFKVRKETDVEVAKKLLKKNQASSIVVVPATFGDVSPEASKTVTVLYDPASQQAGSIVISFVDKVLTGVNYQLQNAKPIYGVTGEKTTSGSFSYFSFVLIGLIGMALMNSNVQSLAINMARYREDKILKRITTTPLPTWQFILAEVASHLVLNILQVGLVIAIGVYVFGGSVGGHVALLFALSLLGAVLFQLIGFVIASATKSASAAEGMSTAITVPMMFLSGVFFPIDQLPKWLFSVVQYLPLSPLLRMMREGALENLSPWSTPQNFIIVLAWIVAALLFAIRRFRLTEE
ncbi:MAG: ABC transporter permease [Candidatus Berkelbacteria bacterium]|nr:ABC transporter permease [Candidatus Berkelbacteria bacterium]